MKVLARSLFAVGAILVLAALAFYLRPLDFYDGYTYVDQAIHGVQHRWVWVDGRHVHYETEGPANGLPVVLVHGLGGRAENWRALAPYLAHAGYRVYMPDLLGFGRSDQPKNFSYSVRDEAALVNDFLDTLQLNRVELGGWSMGGWIVQVLAFQHPERVRRLMLFDSAGIYARPTWDTQLFTPVTIDQLNALNALLVPRPTVIPGFVANDILRTSRETNWVVSRAMTQMLSGRDVTDAMLPQLRMPVLIEWGGMDRITPVNQGEIIHRLVPRSQLQVYGACGHLAPLECADVMGPNVLNFLQHTPEDSWHDLDQADDPSALAARNPQAWQTGAAASSSSGLTPGN